MICAVLVHRLPSIYYVSKRRNASKAASKQRTRLDLIDGGKCKTEMLRINSLVLLVAGEVKHKYIVATV